MRIGIIGAGIHSEVHLAGYAMTPHINVVAVTDVNQPRAQQIAATYGIAKVFGSAAELIACADVDLVDVITPPTAHREPVLTVLNAGKPVLCEKPLSLEPDEASELDAAANAASLLAATSFNRRFDPAMRYLRDLVADGFIGEHRMTTVNVITAWERMHGADASGDFRQWLRSPDTGGGFLRGALPHYVDLLRYLLGEAGVSSATLRSATATQPSGSVSDDIVLVTGTLAAGGVYSVAMTWSAASDAGERWSVVGSERTIVVEPGGSMTATDAAGQTSALTVPAGYRPAAVKGESGFGFGSGGSWAFAAMMDHLAACVAGGDDLPVFATFGDGARNAQLIADIYRLASAPMAAS